MRSYKWYVPWLLVGPAVVWVAVFALWPFVNTVVLSFTNARPLTGGTFVAFDNYAALFSDARVWTSLGTTLAFTVACVPLLTFLPLLLALLVHRVIPGISFFRTTFYFPVIASVVVVALIFQWLFDSRGVINETL
ncbi:MAG: sugar ABC transporter permease, partial [Actinomyces sp.]|nr:sugar ABC transporter permease [Actinomyces sp.]